MVAAHFAIEARGLLIIEPGYHHHAVFEGRERLERPGQLPVGAHGLGRPLVPFKLKIPFGICMNAMRVGRVVAAANAGVMASSMGRASVAPTPRKKVRRGIAFLKTMLETRARTDIRRSAILGALIGCATLVRWQEATLLVLPVLDALWPRAGGSPADWPRVHIAVERIGAAGLAALVVFTPQMLVWNIVLRRTLSSSRRAVSSCAGMTRR